MSEASPNITLADNIYYYLRSKIGHLEIEPGERLSEAGLARQFNCSRVPVREAVQRLVSDGALEVIPQRGSFVTPISMTQLEHCRFIRATIEGRVVLDDFDAGLLEPIVPVLGSIIKRQENLIAVGDYNEVFSLDSDFHLLFYTISHKEYAYDVTGMNDIHYYRARLLTLRGEGKDNMVHQHHMIVDAIENKDRDALDKALNTHFQNVNNVIETKKFVTRKGQDYFTK